MKVIINKFKNLLDKEYEIPLPKRNNKHNKQSHTTNNNGYVNPFKHQQELEDKRQQQIRLQHQQALERLKAQQELEKLRQQQVVGPVTHVKKVEPSIPHTPKQPKKPSFFDKKLEITFPKPKVKVPKFKKVELNILKFTPPEPKPPQIQNPVPKIAENEVKAPILETSNIESPKIETKKPEVKLPEVSLKRPTLSLPKLKKLDKKQQLVFASVILGAALLGVLYTSRASLSINNPQDTEQIAQTAINPAAKVAEAVGKKITLPTGEEPISATVTDRNKLQNQEFFSEAKNGDKILMYKQNKKAYLYRPSTDEVIAVAPLMFEDTAGAATASAEADEPTPTEDPNAPKTSIAPEPPHGKTLVPARY